MCGICGIVTPDRSQRPSRLLRRMILRLRHRGPDEYGLFEDDWVSMAHARLSIIDLSTGCQPIHNEDRSLWIIYNGEVFNYLELRDELVCRGHRFYTTSDTEVIVHAYEEYGPDCLQRFNGQYAIALWDHRRSEIFLARDRVGIRPLFYSRTPGRLAFASEMKCLFLLPGLDTRLDPEALEQTVTFWAPQAPRTPFAGIRELEPGHWLRYRARDDQVETRSYWRIPFDPESTRRDEDPEVLGEELRGLLLDASRLRLRADVPVGAYLSGGLDSSVITLLIRNYFSETPLRTFSIGFEDRVFDETPFQRQVVSHLGTEHLESFCTNQAIAEAFPRVVWHAEVPLLRTAPTPLMLLSRSVRESRFKVVLTGEGADEFLGGYNIYKEAMIRAFWARQPGSAWRPLLLGRLYPYLRTPGNRGKASLQTFFGQGLTDTDHPCYSHLLRWRNTSRIRRYLVEDLQQTARTYDPVEEFTAALPAGFPSWPLLHRAQHIEIRTFLSSYLLSSQGDRVAMANSVEGRYPFLDYRVMEFCARLPPRFKLRGLTEKYLLKRTFASDLPPEIIRRPKQPYRAPIYRSLLQEPRPPYVKALLGEEALRDKGLFSPPAVQRLVDKCSRPEAFVSEVENMALAFILSLQLLHEHFLVRPPESDPDPEGVPFLEVRL